MFVNYRVGLEGKAEMLFKGWCWLVLMLKICHIFVTSLPLFSQVPLADFYQPNRTNIHPYSGAKYGGKE